MTLPSPNNSPTGAGSVPTLPDGTPNFPAGALLGTSGQTSIWDLPSGVKQQKEIWFDIGHKTTNDPSLDMKTGKTSTHRDVSSYQILKSPQAIMRQFAAMSLNDPGKFLALQKALASGPWGTINPTGVFDSDTEKALGNAMAQYIKIAQGAGVGISFTDYLLKSGEMAQSLGGKGTSLGKANSSGGTINLTDPAQIREAAQNAAMQALGQGLSTDQLNKFVAQFQAQQVQNQEDTYTTSTKLPAEAMAFAQQSDPQAYQQNKRQAYLDSLVNLLSGKTTRPDMTPAPTVGG